MDRASDLGIPSWSGPLHGAGSSYETELHAIVRLAMILPSAWEVVIYTDSESSIKAYESFRDCDTVYKSSQWHLLRLLHHINRQRVHPIVLQHVHSHKHLMTPDSVGNGIADFVAQHARVLEAPIFGVPQDIKLLLPQAFLSHNGTAILSFKHARALSKSSFLAGMEQ